MEEQGPAGGAERQVAKLVEDDEIGVGEPRRDLSWFALKLLLFKSVDQFNGGEEADALAMVLNRLDSDRRGEMRLARAGAADQDDVVRILQELAAMKLTGERLVDLAAGEVEAGKVAIVRKAGGFQADEAVDLTSRSAVSAFRSCERIGTAASKAGSLVRSAP